VLARLDIVVASLHSGLRQPRDEIMARIESALRSPHVDVLGHPSGRLLGVREESQVDMSRLLELAAETGTALEVNSTPQRLDLDDVHIRRAVDMGIRIAINSDSHSVEMLGLLVFGVATARRGWAEASDVLNTRSASELLALRKDGPGSPKRS
jgi:DNA polymerase (family X)